MDNRTYTNVYFSMSVREKLPNGSWDGAHGDGAPFFETVEPGERMRTKNVNPWWFKKFDRENIINEFRLDILLRSGNYPDFVFHIDEEIEGFYIGPIALVKYQ